MSKGPNHTIEVELGGESVPELEPDHPFRVLLISDLMGSDKGALSGPLRDGPVEVNAGNFADVMSAASPRARLVMKDPVTLGPKGFELNFCFDSLKGFAPPGLIPQIPAAAALTEARALLVARMRGQIDGAALQKGIAEAQVRHPDLRWLNDSLRPQERPPEDTRPADPGAVDALLDNIDLGDGAGGGGAIGGLVASAAGSGGVAAPEAAAIRKTLERIDNHVSAWLTAVLHADPVRLLEGSWRGLDLLVRGMDFRKGLRLSVLHARPEEICSRLVEQVIDPVFDAGAEAPSLLVVDRSFGSKAPDMEMLDELAQHAASIPAVVIVGAAPEFLGAKSSWQISTLPPLRNLFDQWQFAKWKSLRKKPYSEYLGVVFGRCLTRAAYEPTDPKDLEFAYTEQAVTDSDFVWTSGAVAAACTIAHSFADIGWPTAMAGLLHGRVEGIPDSHAGKKGEKRVGPTDTTMPQPRVEEMAAVGLNAVVAMKEHGFAVVHNGLTAAVLSKPDAAGLMEISLPYRLFATRMSELLLTLRPRLSTMQSAEIPSFVSNQIGSWLGIEGAPSSEQLSVHTSPVPEKPAALDVAVTVTPPNKVVPGGVPVALGIQVGRG